MGESKKLSRVVVSEENKNEYIPQNAKTISLNRELQ